MPNIKREQRIRKAIEDKLWDLLKGRRNWKGEKEPIQKEELVSLSLGIKYLAVSAKLNEGEYGKDLAGLLDPTNPENNPDPEQELENGESDDDLGNLT